MQSGVSFVKLGNNVAFPANHGRDVAGLHPGILRIEYPMGKTPQQAATSINQFMAVKGDFPKSEFCALGWFHSSDKSWWSRTINLVFDGLKELLVQSELYMQVRAI